MRKNISIADAELPIMKILWENNKPMTGPEIINRIEGNKNTLKTLLHRLVTKGAVDVDESVPRNYLYKAALSKDEYIKEQRSGFLQKVFDGNTKGMLLNFVQEEKITKEDLQELMDLIERG